ncbi:MAG: hypothetical protein ABIT69_00320 [Sphingomicrobium sp.]
MNNNNSLAGQNPSVGGSFTEIQHLLRTLFADPDCSRPHCWLELFGEMTGVPARIGSDAFLAPAIRARAIRVPLAEL